MPKKYIEIYTDGSCSPNPGPGGWGWVLYRKDKERKHDYGGSKETTNNIMELTAMIEALDSQKCGRRYHIFSDSQYVVKGLVKNVNKEIIGEEYTGWMKKWKRGGWKNPSKNVELWQELDKAIAHHMDRGSTIMVSWVKGHSDHRKNDRADELANKGREEIVKKESNKIEPMACRTPTFRGQVLEKTGYYKLDKENAVLIINDILDSDQLEEYLEEACKVERKSGRSGFGIKPRREICYSPDGKPYVYSRVKHPTVPYPNHVKTVMDIFLDRIDNLLETEEKPPNKYTVPTSAVDIIYDEMFPQGGSISAHKDDEDDWGMVIVFSLGQTRFLRVRRDEDRKWYNVKVVHNSIVVMYGPTFQSLYTHQVDKLYKDEKVGTRLSLNIRYKESK